MIINQITYTAKGQVAGLDDIITLRLKFIDRSGNVIGTSMISGHSILLSNTVSEIEPIDVDSIEIEATDLDYEGHTLKFNNYEYTIPRTGSLTGTFKIEPVGAPEVTEVSAPGVEAAAPSLEEFAEAMKLPAPIIGGMPASAGYEWNAGLQGWCRPWECEKTFIPKGQNPLWDKYIPSEVAKPVAIGAGAGLAIVAVIALLALGGRKKK